ncbi:sensor histidine kinase [Amycolatopsis palatopharyngis]|uniref:sensor histidine kinase n=1 Tax=Amycolatopsis palatopharyngis TaxID=187982 RepID=UPI000E2358CC
MATWPRCAGAGILYRRCVSPETPVRTAGEWLQRLGLPGVVLLAALLCDLAIIGMASFDSIGPAGSDLALLPGVLAMAACARWASRRPAMAAFAGAGVLVAASVLIRSSTATPYSAILSNVSFTETVAGFELVFFAVRGLHAGVAVVTSSSLVVGGLIAVGTRTGYIDPGGSDFFQSMLFGSLLLLAAVLSGLQGRNPKQRRSEGLLGELMRTQWPVIGVLTLALFLELASAAGPGLRAGPTVVCSMAAALIAVLAARYPVPAALALVAVMFTSGLFTNLFLRSGNSYLMVGAVPLTQITAGLAVVVFLIRFAENRRAWPLIGLLSAVVAMTAIAADGSWGTPFSGASLRQLFVSAALLLGIAVAFGLFLRSRDAQRTQAVQTAVSDAQTAERMALARELHDVVAHHVTGIVVQAQAAKMLAERDPRIAAEAMDRIETAGAEALTAMRRLVRSMRGDAPAGAGEFNEQATTDLRADLRKLVDSANHGVPTEVDLELPPGLPQEVARSTLRLVQESLTNVGKHATGATKATVSVRVTEGELHVRVRDDGNHDATRPDRAAALGSGGYGLIGMRERVELLHGRLSAGPGPDGGWLVEAWLPVEGGEE